MKLVRCHIENFGKISDFTMEFADGINVIKEANGWGKSTLAAFIRIMFYGFDTKKASGSFEKERTVYNPWQGGIYGGELDFTIGKRMYRISRIFGKTEKQDEFHVYNLTTNLESVDYTANIGEEIFDLDSTSFKRSVFIAQNDCESQTSDAINAKLGNLAANTNDINNYETAQEYLKNLSNQMSPTRKTGSIRRRENRLTELRQELRSYEAAEAAVEELGERLAEEERKKEDLSARRDEYAGQLKMASEQSQRLEKQKNYKLLCDEVDENRLALTQFKDTFMGSVPEDEVLSQLSRLARTYEDEQSLLHHMKPKEEELKRLEKLESVFAKGVPSEESIDSAIERLEQLPQVREERTRILTQLTEREKQALLEGLAPNERIPKINGMMILGILIAVLGIGTEVTGILLRKQFAYSMVIIIAGMVLLLGGSLLFVFGYRKRVKRILVREERLREWNKKQKEKNTEIEGLQAKSKDKEQRIQDITNETRKFLEEYQIYSSVREYASKLYGLKNLAREYQTLLDKKQQYERQTALCRAQGYELNALGKQMGISLEEDMLSEISHIQMEAAKYRLAKNSYERAKEKKADFEVKTDMQDLFARPQDASSLEDINRHIHMLDESVETVRGNIEQYIRQMEDLQVQLDQRDAKAGELAECMELQREQKEKYKVITLTQDYLQRAREDFISRYMAPISSAFRKYYEMLIGVGKDEWTIDANISFKRREKGRLRETKWMSVGYQDLIGVCMRLALVDAMFQEEKPFLVLDDPFVNLDEEKTAHGMELLKNVANEYQTIYFTCHRSREPVV